MILYNFIDRNSSCFLFQDTENPILILPESAVLTVSACIYHPQVSQAAKLAFLLTPNMSVNESLEFHLTYVSWFFPIFSTSPATIFFPPYCLVSYLFLQSTSAPSDPFLTLQTSELEIYLKYISRHVFIYSATPQFQCNWSETFNNCQKDLFSI